MELIIAHPTTKERLLNSKRYLNPMDLKRIHKEKRILKLK